MDKKEKFISDKIGVLMREGKYTRPQSIAIAYSYWEKEGQKAQGGGQWYEDNPPMFSTAYGQPLPQAPNLQTQTPTVQSQYGTPTEYTNYIQGDANLDGVVNELDKPKNPYTQNSVNIMNPYESFGNPTYNLNQGMYNLGKGNTGLGIAGIGAFGLGALRTGLLGYSTGKEDKRVQQEYDNNRFERNQNYTYAQQGGEMLRGKKIISYVFDKNSNTYEVEYE